MSGKVEENGCHSCTLNRTRRVSRQVPTCLLYHVSIIIWLPGSLCLYAATARLTLSSFHSFTFIRVATSQEWARSQLGSSNFCPRAAILTA